MEGPTSWIEPGARLRLENGPTGRCSCPTSATTVDSMDSIDTATVNTLAEVPQGDLRLLNDPAARALLGSTEMAHLAYVWRDGTPRCTAIWFHWNGEQLVVVGIETVHDKPVAVCAPRLRKAIAAAVESVTGAKPREMMSGAGHDGQAMIHLTDIGMVFVRCRAGISHNPLEFVTVADLGLAVESLIHTIANIAGESDA